MSQATSRPSAPSSETCDPVSRIPGWDPASRLIGGIDKTGDLAEVASHFFGRAMPLISRAADYAGPVADAESLGRHTYGAGCEFGRDDLDAGWEHVGGAVNNIGSLATTGSPLSPFFTAYQLAMDGVGGALGAYESDAGFNADQVTGEFLRGQFGDKSWGTDVAKAAQGNNLAKTQYLNNASNTGMQAVNLVQNVLRGGMNTVGDLVDDDEVDDDHYANYRQDPLSTMTSTVRGLGDLGGLAGGGATGPAIGAVLDAIW